MLTDILAYIGTYIHTYMQAYVHASMQACMPEDPLRPRREPHLQQPALCGAPVLQLQTEHLQMTIEELLGLNFGVCDNTEQLT